MLQNSLWSVFRNPSLRICSQYKLPTTFGAKYDQFFWLLMPKSLNKSQRFRIWNGRLGRLTYVLGAPQTIFPTDADPFTNWWSNLWIRSSFFLTITNARNYARCMGILPEAQVDDDGSMSAVWNITPIQLFACYLPCKRKTSSTSIDHFPPWERNCQSSDHESPIHVEGEILDLSTFYVKIKPQSLYILWCTLM